MFFYLQPVKRQRYGQHAVVLIGLIFFLSSLGTLLKADDTAVQREFFEKEIRPRLVEHCYKCHSSESEKFQGGLAVDGHQELIAGGDSGSAIVPGNLEDSLLIQAIRYETYEMPPSGKLSDQDIAAFEKWVLDGAFWPEDENSKSSTREVFDLEQRKHDHWVWAPIQDRPLPVLQDARWAKQPLDYFILEKLEEANLKPAADVDQAGLLRRVYFDLIGLPPSKDQVESFTQNQDVNALVTVVDQLLASPEFGERWGRHWLDLVRYAESRGHEFDNDAPNASQYRDYVIRALNADVPYDQFLREHIAGDLIPQPRLNPVTGFNESILGTGFWFLGEWVHSPVDIRADEADRFDNMVDVMSKTFLGMTVACARCHDHKFDAISTADYYALTGFLHSSDFRQVPFESLEHNQKIAQQLGILDQRFRSEIQSHLSQSGLTPPTIPAIGTGLDDTVLVHDFTHADTKPLMQDGVLFGNAPIHAGQLLPPSILSETETPTQLKRAETSGACSDPFWNEFRPIHEKRTLNLDMLINIPRSGRTLRTPTFELRDGRVFCRVRATGHIVACVDSHRLVFGPLHGETIVRVDSQEPAWVELNLARYVGHKMHLEFTPDFDNPFEVSVVLQDPTDDQKRLIEQRESEASDAVKEFAEQQKLAFEKDATLQQSVDTLLRDWASQRAELQSQIMKESRLAMAMLDGDSEDAFVMIRGNANKFGNMAPRNLLTALDQGVPLQIESGSGRMQLADAMNAPTNPLTHRVIVNRVWHHLMGRGIVASTDDFGVLGQRPTHPELLDHLAVRFTENGQSLKQLIKLIVLSRTYQMSSEIDSHAAEVDPKNLLWHSRFPRRLEGEAIRDSLLKLSGRLNPEMYGPSVPIHLTEFMDGRGKPEHSGPLDGEGRRSIYIAVRRNFLSPFMLTFDTPSPFSSMGRRNASNVPAQALILMNDPLVVDLANSWAKRSMAAHSSIEDRVEQLFWDAYSRPPTSIEIDLGVAFIRQQIEERQHSIQDEALWQDFVHALINTKEFIFVK